MTNAPTAPAVPGPATADALAARGLAVRLGGTRDVLSDVTLVVPRGAFVAVVGPNGAGKTTLLRALAGLVPLARGEARLFGRPVGAYTPRERAQRLAFVRQTPPSADAFTVREVVALGRAPHLAWASALTAADHAAVEAALDALDLGALAERPLGALSGGERQRAALAQALAQDTPVLLLDEPTAHLDVRHTLDLLGRARRLADAGRTVVAAVHDLALGARFADRMAVVARGRLVADGAPRDVITPALLADAFGVAAEVADSPDGPTPRYLGSIGLPADSAGPSADPLSPPAAGPAS